VCEVSSGLSAVVLNYYLLTYLLTRNGRTARDIETHETINYIKNVVKADCCFSKIINDAAIQA